MSGLPQGSSPRLSGVINFLANADHPVAKRLVPRAVRPSLRWEDDRFIRTHADNDTLDKGDVVFQAFGEMMTEILPEIDGWSDTEKMHLDITFTDTKGKESRHMFMVDLEIRWCSEANKFNCSLQSLECDITADELDKSLNNIWGD